MATTEKDRVIDELRTWGCDVNGALNRFMGHDDLYMQLLLTIPEQEAFVALGDAIKNKDVKTAFDRSHEIKGVVANMGLTPLYEDSIALVEPLRAGKLVGAEDNYGKLMADLEKLKAILKGN
jgi:hypothetical protein